MQLGKITPLQAQSLETQLLADGLAPQTVGMVHNVLSGVFRRAMRLELVGRNPVSLVSAPTFRKHDAEAPPIETVAEILRIAEASSIRYTPASTYWPTRGCAGARRWH